MFDVTNLSLFVPDKSSVSHFWIFFFSSYKKQNKTENDIFPALQLTRIGRGEYVQDLSYCRAHKEEKMEVDG